MVDEDYREYGFSGELAAITLAAGLILRFARVCVEDTLPFTRDLEAEALPNVARIRTAVASLMASAPS